MKLNFAIQKKLTASFIAANESKAFLEITSGVFLA